MDWFNGKNRIRKFKRKGKNDANYFQHPKWQLVTLLDKYSGLWPYQRKLQQYPLQIFHFFILSTITATVVSKSREYIGVDTEMTIECILTLIFLFAVLFKLTLASVFQSSKQKIYEKVVEHFETMTDAEEAAMLDEFADRGFRFTIIYMAMTCALIGLFDCIPNIKLVYDYFFLNDELKLILPIQMDYGFDHTKYWYLIMLHFLTFFFSGCTLDAAFDLSFILQVRHVQALFEIVRMRLEKATEITSEFEDEATSEDADETYSRISKAIALHSECLEIVKMIEESYKVIWFVLMILNCMMFGALIHLISLRLHDPSGSSQGLCAFAVLLLHFYVIFSQGQRIIDSSFTIFHACYDCQWYRLPKKSSKLLSLMMIRSARPCQLTGAQFFPLTMEIFSKMLKAGISYYTVFQK